MQNGIEIKSSFECYFRLHLLNICTIFHFGGIKICCMEVNIPNQFNSSFSDAFFPFIVTHFGHSHGANDVDDNDGGKVLFGCNVKN